MIENNIYSFERWYGKPLTILRDLPNGDGGFVALAVCCFLYERYAAATIKKTGGKADRDGLVKQFMIDFEVDEEAATYFWTVVRDGILHQGMPKTIEQGKHTFPQLMIRSGDNPVWMGRYKGNDTLFVYPELITDKILKLWKDHPSLIDKNLSFPWATVVPIVAKDFE